MLSKMVRISQTALVACLLIAPLIATDGGDLKLLHLVFRHGQRTPASTYPNDPHKNETFAPYGWGQLTNEGKNQQYEQGKWLKQRYGEFLGDQYTPDLLEAWTTDVDRTKMSAALMFAGLLPPAGHQIWNKDLLWQPIPTSHQKLDKDSLLLVRGCARFSEALKDVMATKQVQDKLASHSDVYELLSKNAGVKVEDPWGVEDIYSTLKAEEGVNLSVPDWVKPVYPDKMRDITAYSFTLNVYNDELKRLKGGPLLGKILKDSQNKAENKLAAGRKLYVYAGHDSTIVNVMSALKIWDEQVPDYNILSIFELREKDGKFGIQVMLRNTTSHEPYEFVIPGCPDKWCPLDKLTEIVKPMLPTDLHKECDAKSAEYHPPTDGGP